MVNWSCFKFLRGRYSILLVFDYGFWGFTYWVAELCNYKLIIRWNFSDCSLWISDCINNQKRLCCLPFLDIVLTKSVTHLKIRWFQYSLRIGLDILDIIVRFRFESRCLYKIRNACDNSMEKCLWVRLMIALLNFFQVSFERPQKWL